VGEEVESYRTLVDHSEAQFKRQGSRFIALASAVKQREHVEAQLAQAKARYPDATHHCFAYRLLLRGTVEARSSDDREPLNTAGPPILRVIEGRELLNVAVVVVRCFGGTKLGIGGLIRAYSDAAKAALDEANIVTRVPRVRLKLRYPNTLTGVVMGVLHRARVDIDAVGYEQTPEVRITLPRAQRQAFEQQLQDACSGRVEVLE